MESAPVAALAHHALLLFLLQVAGLLGLAFALGRLCVRFKMPSVVGELLAGVLLGPSLLGALAPGFAERLFPAEPDQFHLLDAVGQLGVILLVGLTGVEMDLRLVRRRGATAARVSLAGLIVPLGFGVAAGFLAPATLLPDSGDRTVFALFLGVALAVSAIPVAAKILIDMNLIHRNVGQLTLAAAAVDDAIGWLLLSVVSAMATTGVVHGSEVALSVLAVVGTVVGAVVLLRPLAARALRLAGRDDGPFVAVVAVIVIGSAAATHAMKLEAILGGFVAGLVIASCREFDHARIASLRTVVLGVLAPLFFATAGLRVDLTALADPTVALAGVVVLTLAIAGKFGGAYLGAKASRLGHWEAVALGAGLNARGVIGLVVAGAGLRLAVLTPQAYTLVVLVAVVTSLMTPPVLRAAMSRVERTSDEELRERDAAGIVPVTRGPVDEPASTAEPA